MLGVIADDFTGASDIASFLVENGLNTVQMNGVPLETLNEEVDAIVISLKSRSNPVDEAVEQSLKALKWLLDNGCSQFYFKYCSTFDSTDKGNIGPVTDALLDELGENFTVISPALPINGRTIFNGYLFAGNVLLNESGMQHHPITPMRDSSLIRLMDAQAKGKTGLVNYLEVNKGLDNVRKCLSELKDKGFRYAVVDAVDNSQLEILANAVQDFKLVTGGSGLAAYIANKLSNNKRNNNKFSPDRGSSTVVLSGSCSVMTNCQVVYYKSKAPSIQLDIKKALNEQSYVEELYKWVVNNLNHSLAPMVYATVLPDQLKIIQNEFGAEQASQVIEDTFSQLAVKLKDFGIKNFIIAGGETSSIVVQKLAFSGFHIGKQIAPGVPWLKSIGMPVYLALKSGNFGKEDFFEYSQEMFNE